MQKSTLESILIQIWPTIRRAINDIWFFFVRIIKSFIKVVLQELW
jgi:hypothetical protein